VGSEITDLKPCYATTSRLPAEQESMRCPAGKDKRQEQGSIIAIIGTDAPLLPHQLRRLARRASLGVARMGGIAGAGSGDLFLAFSTGKTGNPDSTGVGLTPMLQDDRIDPVYEATVQATEEAIINAMLAAETMIGADDLRVPALPHDRLKAILKRYGR
jgi:L-aminopeptidase/D-esterase-like protein